MDIFLPRTRLTRSIHFTFYAYFIFQLIMFGVFCVVFKIPLSSFFLFSGTTLLFHLLVLVVLLQFIPDFVNTKTGEQLSRVNLANRVTLARLSTLPTVLFLVLASKDFSLQVPLFVLVAIVFMTDFFDGWISRTTHQITKIGKLLDSVSDYSLLFFLSIILCYFTIIPLWFFVLVVFRLVTQSVLATILVIRKRSFEAKSSFPGKASVAATMSLYGLEMLRLLLHKPQSILWSVIEWTAGLIVFISIFDKLVLFLKKMREPVVTTENKTASS